MTTLCGVATDAIDDTTLRYMERVKRFRRLHARMQNATGPRYLMLLSGMRQGRCKGAL